MLVPGAGLLIPANGNDAAYSDGAEMEIAGGNGDEEFDDAAGSAEKSIQRGACAANSGASANNSDASRVNNPESSCPGTPAVSTLLVGVWVIMIFTNLHVFQYGQCIVSQYRQ